MSSNRRNTLPLVVSGLLCGVLVPTSAFAFDGVSYPWRSTPHREIATRPLDNFVEDRPVLRDLSLRAVTYRRDGNPALMWAFRTGAPRRLEREAASAHALDVSHALAADLGVAADDLFVQGAVQLDDHWTTVTIGQRWRGLEAHRGALVLTYRDGQLSTVRNDLVLHALQEVAPKLTPDDASSRALAEAQRYAADARLKTAATLEIWTSSDHPEDARLAYKVHASAFQPRAELTFHLDAATGEVLGVDDAVRYAAPPSGSATAATGEGRVQILSDNIYSMTPPVPFTMKFIGLTGNAATDGDGDAIEPGPVQATYSGPYAQVVDASGAQLDTFTLNFGGSFQLLQIKPTTQSQADPFTHVNFAKAFDMLVMPKNQFLFQQIPINVNLAQTCNAYFDGTSVNFFVAGNGCTNSGEIKTIVYHEFGHGVHLSLSTTQPDGAVGEGTADFHSAHIADTAEIGTGFMPQNPTGGTRNLAQPKVYPTNVVGEVHADGQIWATALWDFRTAMIKKLGDWEGKQVTYQTFLRALTQNPTLATAYPAIIAGDDDDNDPTNGTPNSCELNAIFQAHGLVNGGNLNHTLAGTRAFVRINHTALGKFPLEKGAVTLSATAENRSTCGTFNQSDVKLMVAQGASGGTFAPVPLTADGAGGLTAALSGLNPGDSFRYYFTITTGVATFTNGTADSPHLGVATASNRKDILRESFESGLGNWTHGTVSGGLKDDWEVAAPLGLAKDPFQAHDGMMVVGTDLGGQGGPTGTDGVAKAGRSTYLQAPPIATTGKQDIRLEFWQQFSIKGTLHVLVDGQEAWSYTGDGTAWSLGWRFLSIPLQTASDKANVDVRFVVNAAPDNQGGGWTLDDVAVTGTDIQGPGGTPAGTPGNGDAPGSAGSPAGAGAGSMGGPGATPGTGAPGAPSSFSGGVGGGCVCMAPAAGEGAGVTLVLLGLGILGRRAGRRRGAQGRCLR